VDPTLAGLVVFLCTFVGALLGMRLRSRLPADHIDSDSRDTVKLGVGLIATMTALVLGLVTASAKSTFDGVDRAVRETAIEILTLDRLLARYGSETAEVRDGLQRALKSRVEALWPEGSAGAPNLEAIRAGAGPGIEGLADAIVRLQPRDDSQRFLKSRAFDMSEALLKTRWLALAATQSSVPLPFLVILVFWLTITFASFGLFAPRNGTVIAVLLVCALSVGSAVFLVLEMDGPFEGLIKVSAEPLRSAYAHLNQ
jgi:hypothetical protein